MGSKMIIINSSLVKHTNEKQVFNDSSETFCQYHHDHLLNLSNPIIFVQCTTYYDTWSCLPSDKKWELQSKNGTEVQKAIYVSVRGFQFMAEKNGQNENFIDCTIWWVDHYMNFRLWKRQ